MITLHGIEQIILATACCVFLIAAPIRAFAAATLDDEPLRPRRNKNRETRLQLICDCAEIVGGGAVAVAVCLVTEVLIRAITTAMILPNLPF